MIRIRAAIVGAALLTAFAPRGELHAQQTPISPRRPTRVPVTLVLVDTLSGEAPFRILRRSNVAPHDVIILRADTDSVALSAAVRDLLFIRRTQGDTAGPVAVGPMRVRRASRPPVREARLIPWAARVMDDLRLANRETIVGVGAARTVRIWLPPQRRREPRK